MFENLSDRLNKVLKYLKGEVKITEENMQVALREIRMSLLEADVNFKVVKKFIDSIREKILGKEIQESLNPYQQIVKIVREELEEIFGTSNKDLFVGPRKGNPVMFVGLQGTGKTTTVGKLAHFLKEQGKTALLCSLDLKRLAAVEQLETIAKEIGVNFHKSEEKNIQGIIAEVKKLSADYGYDYILADTAGRLHIDDELMNELLTIKQLLNPVETIFVADSLTGQDAVNSAQSFAERIGIDSIILTKLDADARGGAALSIVQVTGKPIKFIGVGEKFSDFQKFYPDRMAAKILGMGDVLTLIEKAEKNFDEKQSEKMAQRLLNNEFTLDDFLQQLQQIEKMGSLSDVMSMLPGIGQNPQLQNVAMDDRKVRQTIAIIQSMTRNEREYPKIIDGRRRLRISRGSGRSVQEINQLLKNYNEMRNYMKKPFFKKMMKKFDIFSKLM